MMDEYVNCRPVICGSQSEVDHLLLRLYINWGYRDLKCTRGSAGTLVWVPVRNHGAAAIRGAPD